MLPRLAPILLYHRVGPRDGSSMDRYTVSPQSFAAQMTWLAERRWRPVPVRELVGRRIAACPPRALAITFDDGFASNREHAWPVLQSLGFPASTFVVTGRMGSFNDWDPPDRAHFPLLSADDLARADPTLMTFYSHSATHADLTFLTDDANRLGHELEESRRALPPHRGDLAIFAYPRGSWTWDLKLAVERAGYDASCSCMEGLNSASLDPYLLRRVAILEEDVGWRLELKLRTGRDLRRMKRPPFVEVALARARRTGGPFAPLIDRWRPRRPQGHA
jgi:peptidoglycan/xylan/chitin deacetylase (PgdA/CDA1 family)